MNSIKLLNLKKVHKFGVWDLETTFVALFGPEDVRKHRQKTFAMLSRFWLLRGWRGFNESIN